jgi:hypothetical protein
MAIVLIRLYFEQSVELLLLIKAKNFFRRNGRNECKLSSLPNEPDFLTIYNQLIFKSIQGYCWFSAIIKSSK